MTVEYSSCPLACTRGDELLGGCHSVGTLQPNDICLHAISVFGKLNCWQAHFACLLACLLACSLCLLALLACLLARFGSLCLLVRFACLLALRARSLAGWLAGWLACLLACVLACLRACVLLCMLARRVRAQAHW